MVLVNYVFVFSFRLNCNANVVDELEVQAACWCAQVNLEDASRLLCGHAISTRSLNIAGQVLFKLPAINIYIKLFGQIGMAHAHVAFHIFLLVRNERFAWYNLSFFKLYFCRFWEHIYCVGKKKRICLS